MLKKFKEELNKKGEVYLKIKASPGSEKTEIKDILKGEETVLKINISAPPEKGRANKELIKYLSNEFDVIKDNIKILSGAGDKIKILKIKK